MRFSKGEVLFLLTGLNRCFISCKMEMLKDERVQE